MSTKCSEIVYNNNKITNSAGGVIPEGGESLYCEAGLLPLNR